MRPLVAVSTDAPRQAIFAEALLRFLAGLRRIPSLRRVAYTVGCEQIDLWILLDEDSRQDFNAAFQLDREFRLMAGDPPVETHFVALTEVPQANLPPAETLFAR